MPLFALISWLLVGTSVGPPGANASMELGDASRADGGVGPASEGTPSEGTRGDSPEPNAQEGSRSLTRATVEAGEDERTSGAPAPPVSREEPPAVSRVAIDETRPPIAAQGAYLARPLPSFTHFLDHGVMAVELWGGWPSVYRVGLSLGLGDHLSLGAAVRALPEQPVVAWTPRVALALWRDAWWAVGFRYEAVLHRAPSKPADPEDPAASSEGEPLFEQRTHYAFGTLDFARGPWSAGVDVGAVNFRDTALDAFGDPYAYRRRWLPAGGIFTRFGTRRWGVALEGKMPVWTLELRLDVRFGIFEGRPRGGWTVEEARQSGPRRYRSR